MFRTALCVALATTAVTTAASGAAPSCTTDPRGDVAVGGSLVPADAPHLDLVRFSVTRAGSDLVATFHTAGGPGHGTWSMFFEFDRHHEYYVRVVKQNGISPAIDDPRIAQLDVEARVAERRPGGTTRDLKGVRADLSRPRAVRVLMPLKQVGPAAPKRGTVLRVTWALAKESQLTNRVEFDDEGGCGFGNSYHRGDS